LRQGKGAVMGQGKKFQVDVEILFDFILVILGALIIIISLAYGFGTFRRPGPGLYPFFIGGFIFVFSIVLLIAELRSPAKGSLFDPEGIKTFLLMTAAFCLWIVVMPVLGYVLVTFLATFAFGKIMKLEGWWKPLAVSAGTALFIYLLFDYWLYIDLPRGILG
jgi:putative tricarboxylic transport membrane protein